MWGLSFGKKQIVRDDWPAELEFVDEVKFREVCKRYFELLTQIQALAGYGSTAADELIQRVCTQSNSMGEQLRPLVRPSQKTLGGWGRAEPFTTIYDSRVNRERINPLLKALSGNRDLLLRILETADDPALSAARRKRQLERRGLTTRRIFVVHGHDDRARQDVASFLKSLDFEPVVLHEQANLGKTVIEKFEANTDVGFAVVLLTPDDRIAGGADGERPSVDRARQNVILELGYFIAKLGRDRVCALKKGDIELPSDILGIAYTNLDDAGAWKLELARELSAVGFTIEAGKLLARQPT